jgi:hypothetical protein
MGRYVMKRRWILTGVLALVLMSGVVARLAMADSVQHFSLMARTMQPADSSIRYDTNDDGYLRTVQESSMIEETVYIGQVDLPDGATVVDVRAFGLDDDPFGEFCFGLVHCNLYDDPVCSAVTQVVCSGESVQTGKTELQAPVHTNMALVDNENYSYNIFVRLPTPYNPPYQDLGILRFRVDTSYNAQLPIVKRNWSSQ